MANVVFLIRRMSWKI